MRAKCIFGRHHTWAMGLSAALRENERITLPDDAPKWVWYCLHCGPTVLEDENGIVDAGAEVGVA